MTKVNFPDSIPMQAILELAESWNLKIEYKNGEVNFVDQSNVIRAPFGKIRMNLVSSEPTPPGAA